MPHRWFLVAPKSATPRTTCRPGRSFSALLGAVLWLSATAAIASLDLDPASASAARDVPASSAPLGDVWSTGLQPGQPARLNPAHDAHGFDAMAVQSGPGAPKSFGPNAYWADPQWGLNGFGIDRFASTSDGVYFGRAIARLSTGETVVAAATNRIGFNADRQLQLVKLGSNGQRLVWTGAGIYGSFSNQYIRFPNGVAGGPLIEDVHDIKIGPSNRIYVLVTQRFNEGGQIRYRPYIIKFNQDGSGAQAWTYAPSAEVNNWAVAMDVIGNSMVVLGSRNNPGNNIGGFWTMRQNIDSGTGALSLVANSIVEFPTPGGIASTGPADVAFERRGLFSLSANPKFYVAYTKRVGFTNPAIYDPCLMRINGNNTPDTTFGLSGGTDCYVFNLNGENDRAVALVTRGSESVISGPVEDLYLLARVSRSNRDGFGVQALRNGVASTSFGSNGRRTFGGCANGVGEGCVPAGTFNLCSNRTHQPLDLVADSTAVSVVGFSQCTEPTLPGQTVPRQNPFLARVSAATGVVSHFRDHPSGFGNAEFWAIAQGEEAGQLLVAGTTIDASIPNASARSMLTSRLVPRTEQLFSNGFEP